VLKNTLLLVVKEVAEMELYSISEPQDSTKKKITLTRDPKATV